MKYALEKNGHWQYQDHDEHVVIDIPHGWKSSLHLVEDHAISYDSAMIRNAIRRPKYGKSIRALAEERRASSASILIPDATRGVPIATILEHVIAELSEAGISNDKILVTVAVGVHRAATESELKEMSGAFYGIVSLESHDAFDRKNLVYIGQTSRGTPVEVNRKAYACDLHLQIGKVEPHEFAGFSGGRKSVLPGICGEETIIANHLPEMILDQRAVPGILKGNPVHEDMLEASRLFRLDFGVNCVINEQNEITGIFCGEVERCHSAAVRCVEARQTVQLPPADVVVTKPGDPMNINFYQSLKAVIALTEVLEPSTKVVLYCDCPEGVSSPDMLQAFRSGKTIEDVIAYTKANYRIQMDHTLLLSKVLRKGVEVFVASRHLEDASLRDMYLQPARSPQDAFTMAVAASGKAQGTVVFCPRAQTRLLRRMG